MSDPVRWLSGTEASGEERALLRSARPGEPPADAEDRIWAALALRLPPTPDGGGGGDLGGGGLTGGAAGGLGALGALKSATIGALAGFVVAGAAALAESPPIRHPAPASADSGGATAAAPAAPGPTAAASAARAEPAQRTIRVPAIATPALSAAPGSSVGAFADSREARETQLRDESRALQAVRDALRRGDAAGALATLEATRIRYPASVLGQEREALTIQALARAGQRDSARSRARAFLQKYPTSPHAESLARFAAP